MLVGTAVTQVLPISDFRGLQRNESDALDVYALRDDDETDYIFEVDLQYPQHLHGLQYP